MGKAEEEAAVRKAEEEAAARRAAEEVKLDSAAAIVEARYTLEQLTDKRLWEKLDVVPTERETYLCDEEFEKVFGKSKADFAKLPKWKKDGEKKKHGLF